MAQKHSFLKGVVLGSLIAAGTFVGSALAYHKTVIEPEDKLNDRIDENRKRANRKAHSAQSSH